MKQYSTIVLSALLLLGTHTAISQVRGHCGVTDPMPLLERVTELQRFIAENPLQTRSALPKYVPVTCIRVADDNGNGRAREEQVLEQMAKMNFYYEDQEMIFYIDEWRILNNSIVYNTPGSAGARFWMRTVRDNNAMSVFVTQSAESGSGNPGVTLGYYDTSEDWIVIRRDEFNGFNNTLAHEAGHFFSLPHPHSGWECDPYDEAKHGNPVNIIWSPCISNLRIEFQNGTNCQIAGDRICDTSPDYNFGFGWSVGGNQCADYTRIVRDWNGDTIDVAERNHMAYFINCPDYFFTPNQKTIIQSDFLSARRTYLRRSYVPVQDPVTNEVVYNYPINGEQTPTFDNIDLDWEDVPGATDYLVIVDRASSFTFTPQRFLVSESFLTIEQLTPNVNYFWKVWPFNESRTGAGWAPHQQFRTGVASAVTSIPYVEHLDVFPNPVHREQPLTIRIASLQSFDAQISLYSITGAEVWHRNQVRVEGGQEFVFTVDMIRPESGLYFLSIRSADGGVITKKVSIL